MGTRKIPWIGLLIWVGIFTIIGIILNQKTGSFLPHRAKNQQISQVLWRGYDATGAPSWHAYVQEIVLPSQSAYLEGRQVKEGVLYGNDSKPLIIQLESDTIQATLDFDKIMGKKIRAKVASGNLKKAELTAGTVEFFSKTKQGTVGGPIWFKQGQATLESGGGATLDTIQKELRFLTSSSTKTPTLSIETPRLTVNLATLEYRYEIGVHLCKPKLNTKRFTQDERIDDFYKQHLELDCERLNLIQEKDTSWLRFEAKKGVVINQNGKKITADEAIFDLKNEVYFFKGNVRVRVPSLEMLLTKEQLKKIENKDWQKMIQAATLIETQNLILDMRQKKLHLEGKVKLTQKGVSITASTLEFNDLENRLIISEACWQNETKMKFEASYAVVNLKTGKIEAKDQIKTEFYKRNKKHD